MKKSIAWLILCCGLITFASACGGGEKKPSAPKPDSGGE